MKLIIFIFLLLILGYAVAFSQTSLPQSTTVYDFSKMKNGFYRIVSTTDTVDVFKDSNFCSITPSSITYLLPEPSDQQRMTVKP
jgi:hypothetical protein